MKATNILKSKRGVAIENAILFLLVVFALCSLLTMIALIANYQFKIDKIVLEQDVAIDQIGEDFIAIVPKIESDGVTELNNENYHCPIEKIDDKYVLTVKPKDSETILLYVEAKSDGTILSWRYSAPTPPEP